MHTKPPKPGYPMTPVVKGEAMGGHPRSHHTIITQPQMADRLRGIHPKAPPSPPGKAPATVTRWNSKADEKRAARLVAKNPAVQNAMKQVAAAKPGTPQATARVTVPVPPGKGPSMQTMRSGGTPPPPGTKPPVIVQRPGSIPVKITKTNQGIGYRTMFGQPGPPNAPKPPPLPPRKP
jgi:hypothetical protein